MTGPAAGKEALLSDGSDDFPLDHSAAVDAVVAYGVRSGLVADGDRRWTRNRLIELLALADLVDRADLVEKDAADSEAPDAHHTVPPEARVKEPVDATVNALVADAAARGLLDPASPAERDRWRTAIFSVLVPPPSVVTAAFWADWAGDPTLATDRFHDAQVAARYIREDEAARTIAWEHPSPYGPLAMTINVAKPELDPRDIARAAQHEEPTPSSYPACLLCPENEGYPGRAGHPARGNLRLIPMELDGEPWFLQYSPYRYFDEHCIVLSQSHRPMRMDAGTLRRLAAVTALLPHYLVGSNADIPIVGGSILTHDHFQGGAARFPMESARVLAGWALGPVTVEVLDWPLTVLRFSGPADDVVDAATELLEVWRTYRDDDAQIDPGSEERPHNSVTPIARRLPGNPSHLRLDVALRNNRTSDEHPDGVFHPHAEIHHVKRENIGLIEVLGLAILPGRLAAELQEVAQALADGSEPGAGPHRELLTELRAERGLAPGEPLVPAVGESSDQAAWRLVRDRAAERFVTGLEQCAVFGPDPVPRVRRLLDVVGWDRVELDPAEPR